MKKIILILMFLTMVLQATVPTTQNVTKLYIATFERAPDSAGLEYWVSNSGLSLEGIAESFFDQDETKATYPESATNDDFINAIYNNLFNRTPDSDGFNYWLTEISGGNIKKSVFILAVVTGALGDDETILKNKTTIGLIFATQGNSSVDDAKNIMKDINADPTSVSDTLQNYNLTEGSTQEELTIATGNALTVSKTVNAKWDGGFCDNIIITNPTDVDLLWDIEIIVDGDIYTLWNANYTYNSTSKILTASGVDWNKIAKAHNKSEFGYCATTTGTTNNNDSNQEDDTLPTVGKSDFTIADYTQVLGLSLQFYEAQHSSGAFPVVSWRQPAGLTDGSDVGRDLSGGWFDAGDGVKFNMPMAYSATMLNWGMIAFDDAYLGQGGYGKEQVRYALDYLIQTYNQGADLSNPSDDIIYYQVGNVTADHNFWGPPEDMTMSRPTYSCDSSRKCSEVAGEMAAAFASGAIALAPDMHYAATLVEMAKKVYLYGKTYQGNNGYTATEGAYASNSGYNDELAWAGVWLYLATNEVAYLNEAKSFLSKANDGIYWSHSWDNVSNGTRLLLYKITKDSQYKSQLDQHFTHWTSGINYTTGGLAFLDRWGSLRYASTTAFLALVYAQELSSGSQYTSLVNFARGQIDYILGDNPRNSSYVIGYGVNSPINPHHRASHNSSTHSINSPTNNEFLLKGALVGGPKSANDFDYQDNRSDYIANEVATDYNAGFTGAVAGLIELGE